MVELWHTQLDFFCTGLKYYPDIRDEICGAGHVRAQAKLRHDLCVFIKKTLSGVPGLQVNMLVVLQRALP